MAIAKDEALADDLTDKLKTYQELKEQYLTQKQELKDEGLEQKSLTDPDSRRVKITAHWISATMYSLL